jgi:branched-chain amino acid transport system substrate-binding protein
MKAWFCAFLATIICLTPVSVRAAEPYDIYAILSLTGIAAFLGKGEAAGLRGLETVENKDGGIHGRPIKFVIVDDESNPVNSVQLANQLIAKGVPVILGPGLNANCKAVYALVVKNGPVEYCFSPALYPPPGSFGFSSGASAADLSRAAMRYFRAQGWNRIALITSTDASGQDGEQLVTKIIGLPENNGVTLVANEYFNVTDLSVDAQVARIKAASPQAIIAWTTGTPTGTVLRSLHNAAVNVPVFLNASNVVRSQLNGYASIVPSQLLLPGFSFMAPNLAVSPQLEREQQIFFDASAAQNVVPEVNNAFAWDPTRVVINALRHLPPNPTAVQLRDAMEQTHDFPGVFGMLDYRDGNQRGVSINSVVIVEWDAGKGTFIPVSKPGGMPLHN